MGSIKAPMHRANILSSISDYSPSSYRVNRAGFTTGRIMEGCKLC